MTFSVKVICLSKKQKVIFGVLDLSPALILASTWILLGHFIVGKAQVNLIMMSAFHFGEALVLCRLVHWNSLMGEQTEVKGRGLTHNVTIILLYFNFLL